MRSVQIRLTKQHLDKIDELVEEGAFPNRSEMVRHIVREYLLQHFYNGGEH